MKENRQQNRDELTQALMQTKKTVMKQAGLAVVAVAVTVVMVFAMTVAWYSNILHTSDLTFKAESWDFTFEGSINLGQNNQLLASPGDSGYVNLNIANVSDKANYLGQATDVANIGVNVNIDKTDLGVLNNRVYFYVEKQTEVNGETVNKIYINDVDTYLYTIYAGKTLSLSEEYSNDYPLKWEWVYDVTGYYVRGTLQPDNTIDVEEYLQPVEFNDITKMFEFDDAGNIISYGDQSIDQYILENYLMKDGYTGGYVYDELSEAYTLTRITTTVDGVEQVVPNLYKITDDIWIVLCTKEQMEANNQLDTMMGKGQFVDEGENPSYAARIVLTGSKSRDNQVTVESAQSLIDSINNGTDTLFVLRDNLTLDAAPLVVASGTDAVLDLNGYTLTMTQPIESQANSSITLMNGTITAPEGSKITMINAEGAEIYMDNIISTGFYSGIEVYDSTSTSNMDSHVYISQSQIETKDSVVWLRGNGDRSYTKTTLIVENTTLTSTEYVAIGGNGTSQYYGTDILISKSTLNGYYSSIFHPMNKSTLLVKDSTLTGKTGLAIKGGSITIDNCTVIGTGENVNEPMQVSGFAVNGEGVCIEDNYSTLHGYEIDVIITGENTFIKSNHNRALNWIDGTAEKAGLAIYAGKLNSFETNDEYMNLLTTKYLATGKVATLLADGTIEINDAPASTPESE
ncbi:MAG: hypothetical protein IKU28_08215 [Erysipelotrichaceae bacterium]|nr:hypothetical protein [Erysipelotrichaceae bacterium]